MKTLAKAKKLKRFEDGGEVSEDVKSFAGTPENDSNAGMADATSETATETEAAKPEYKSFKEAFAANRKAGAGTFEYNGKKYTTELAGARKETTAAKPAAEASKPKYQSLQDRSKSYEDARAKSGVGMYGTTKSAPKEERKPLPLKSTKSETGNKFMGATKYASGGVVARASVKSHGKAC